MKQIPHGQMVNEINFVEEVSIDTITTKLVRPFRTASNRNTFTHFDSTNSLT